MRKVYLAHDEDGDLVVHQENALGEMGIERPDLERKSGRYNNSKMTYTKMCREHFTELCKSYGLEIIEEPKEKSESGKQLDVYIRDKELKEIEEGKKYLEGKKEELKTIGELQDKKEEEFQAREDKLEAQKKALEKKEADIKKLITGADDYFEMGKRYYVDNQNEANKEGKERIRRSRMEYEKQKQRGENLKQQLRSVKDRDRDREFQ